MKSFLPWLALLAGCASSQPMTVRQTADEEQARLAYERLLRDHAQLETPSAEARPACARACELRTNICELSDLICRIAARHPGAADLDARCNDGRSRCGKATMATAERCACEAPR